MRCPQLSLALALASVASGCSRDRPDERMLTVSGPTPYRRCLAAAPPASRAFHVGRIRLRLEGRALTVEASTPVRIAAFAGPAFHRAPGDAELAALRSADPDLLLLLGDIGDELADTRATLRALATLAVATLVLAGGRDTRANIGAALDSLGPARRHVVDISALIAVRIAGDTLIPIAGAFEGRYALSAQGCGYGPIDIQRLARAHPDTWPGRRWLLGWEAPWVDEAGLSISTRESPLTGLAERLIVRGGLFAWPAPLTDAAASSNTSPAIPERCCTIVPRLTGSAPAFALLQVSATGLELLEIRAVE
jgi:hypothetical protein